MVQQSHSWPHMEKYESFNLKGYMYHSVHNRTIYNSLDKEKKCKKAKWLSKESLQIAVNRREAKAKEKRKDIPICMQSSRD